MTLPDVTLLPHPTAHFHCQLSLSTATEEDYDRMMNRFSSPTKQEEEQSRYYDDDFVPMDLMWCAICEKCFIGSD